MEVLTDAEIRLRDAASKKILLEVALLKAIEARNAVSLDAVLKQLQQLRGESGEALAPARRRQPRRRPASEAAPAPNSPRAATDAAPASPPPTPVASRRAGRRRRLPATIWKHSGRRLVEAVGRASPFTRSYLLEAHPVSFAKNVFTIGFDPEFEDHIGLVDNARNHTLLQTKLAELGHANAQFKFIKAEAPAALAAAHRRPAAAAASRRLRRPAPRRRLPEPPPAAASRARKSSPPCRSTRTISRTTR